jgi:hypothetical protein
MSHHYLILLLALCIPATAYAETIVYDHFGDGVLDPAWEVTFNEFACGWTYAEEVSDLHVTEICHDGTAGDWAIVSLSQPCPAPSDCYVAWKFAWRSPYGLPDTRQCVYLMLSDETDAAIAYVGHSDAWVSYGGAQVAWVRGAEVYVSGQGTLPYIGSATVIMNRVGGVITFKWDDEVIFEAPESTPVASIKILFYYMVHSNTSTNVDESVDFIRVADSIVIGAPDATPYPVPMLAGIHPNPFNPLTTVSFSLPRTTWTDVSVYDLTGREVTTLASKMFNAGEHTLTWKGRDTCARAVPSGTYIVRLETEDRIESRKVMLVR